MTMDSLKGVILKLNNLVQYQDGTIVSRELLRKETGRITIFAFDKDQGLSEHTSPFDATVYILDGKAEIKIGDKKNILSEGEMMIMPANISHALFAIEKFKMLLIMIRD